MICLFSTAVDLSTTEVIRWLHRLGRRDVLRINSDRTADEPPIALDVADDTFSFRIDDRVVHLEEIDVVWYRKGGDWLVRRFDDLGLAAHPTLSAYLRSRLRSEAATLSEYLHFIIDRSVPTLGSADTGNLNKLRVLHCAREIGFTVPRSFVTNSRQGARGAFADTADLVAKSMSDGVYLFAHEPEATGYFTYTEQVGAADLENLPDTPGPASFFQQRVDKAFDARVFVLDGECFAMSIFSQAHDRTRTDFRKYVRDRPSRCVPLRLPADVERDVLLLFDRLRLDTGSVDFAVDRDGAYHFLEINPVGQFAMLSEPCNYPLHRKVAESVLARAGNR